MTKQQFLLDTLKYYIKNPRRRCAKNGMCNYDPKKLKLEKVSEGCAIGRVLSEPAKEKLSEFNYAIDDMLKEQPKLKKYLPNWMQKENPKFLRDIQRLHDVKTNWNKSGLTRIGKLHVEDIIRHYNLNKTPFRKYLNN